MIRNPVARHINTFNKPSVEPCKRRSLQSEATLRDAAQSLSEEIVDSESLCFDGHFIDLWVLDELSEIICEGDACLGSVSCSSISIDASEEDEK